jgi:hypothetical protein
VFYGSERRALRLHLPLREQRPQLRRWRASGFRFCRAAISCGCTGPIKCQVRLLRSAAISCNSTTTNRASSSRNRGDPGLPARRCACGPWDQMCVTSCIAVIEKLDRFGDE